MPSFYMNAPDCICSPGRLPLGAFCAGRDDLEREALHDDRISIRAPRAGCDHYTLHVHLGFGIFQSTRPVWGATVLVCPTMLESLFQSTRPVWGATFDNLLDATGYPISIHAPRVGRDTTVLLFDEFQSISIHAPRVGRDRRYDMYGLHRHHFNPRAPCGARLLRVAVISAAVVISIHAPRVGRDWREATQGGKTQYFNPRAPCGARHGKLHSVANGQDFNPRAPCGARRSCPV